MEDFEPEVEVKEENTSTAQLTNQEPAQKMNWTSTMIAVFSMFIVAVQFSIYFSSLWPYMHTIDPSANQTFYGFTLAIFSFGQMSCAPLFGYLSTRFKTARPIIATGMLFSIFGNIVYMFVETVPVATDRKWVLMAARLLGGIGAGVSGMIRGYIANSSTAEHRKRAIAIGTMALSLGITAGPAIQAAVTPIGYPAYIWGPLHFNQYTAPAYISIVAALILLVFLLTLFRENYVGIDTKRDQDPFHFVPKYDRAAALLCILCWFSLFFTITNSETVESPMSMAVFGWSSDEAVYYNSIIITVSSAIAFVGFTLIAIFGKYLNERKAIFTGLTLLCLFYMITYPWPFFPNLLQRITVPPPSLTTPTYGNSTASIPITTTQDITELGGCFQEWCSYTPQLPLWLYLASYPLLSLGLPLCQVPISTLLAQILGPRRQGFIQSLMIMAGSCARMLGPILISWLFDNYGPRVAWTMTASVVSVSIVALTILNYRLVPLVMRPRMKTGDKLRYDGGLLYHF